jgi:prepilin-type N-terminal cleavage/methylation domain-containing protein
LGKEGYLAGSPYKFRKRGFTLIEVAIVLTVVGLMLASFLKFYAILDQKERIETTRERMATLRTSLIYYVLTHQRLPCPASGLKQTTGSETDPCAPDQNNPPEGVDIYSPAVDTRQEHSESFDIWTGVVPVHELQLDPQMAVDGWGNKFTFAVSRNLTMPNAMRGNPLPKGHIPLVDADGTSVLEAPGTGRYVIISHGPSGAGAWSPDGAKRACPKGTLSEQNCSNSGNFVLAPWSTAHGKNSFENIVISDDQNVGGTLLDRMGMCSLKLMFYEPGRVDADKDGCVRAGADNGSWHGICLKYLDPNAAVPVQPVLRPAIAKDGNCACLPDLGYTPMLAGSWVETPQLPDSAPPGTGMVSLYTCVLQ